MKKSIFMLALATMLMAGGIFTGCQSSADKVNDAQTKVQDAKQDLKQAQLDSTAAAAQRAANAEEWKQFKSDVDVKIKENETRIAELKEKMKKSGNKLDAAYQRNIDALEQKTNDLKRRADTYQMKTASDWESFKREFNHDMDDLGKALKDFTVNNKK